MQRNRINKGFVALLIKDFRQKNAQKMSVLYKIKPSAEAEGF
jgi:hypothetical protein